MAVGRATESRWFSVRYGYRAKLESVEFQRVWGR